MIPVKDHPHLVRDEETKAVLVMDHESLEHYRLRKRRTRETEQRLSDLEDKISQILEILKSKL